MALAGIMEYFLEPMTPKLIITTFILMTLAEPLLPSTYGASFAAETAFLQKHTEVLVLQDKEGSAKIAVAPSWQGRVMTSTAGGDADVSYGWINHDLIESGKLEPHINVFGGEDRFWIGPEGGQFSVFFAPGTKFDLSNWFTPPPVDTLPYQVASHSAQEASFKARFPLTNYSGTRFDVQVERVVRVLEPARAWGALGIKRLPGVKMVAYESDNKMINAGHEPWKQSTGLLSIWILGQFNPSPGTTIVVPIKSGPDSTLGVKVTSDYFGTIPPDRLAVKENVVYLRGDGQFRSKIGINPKRSLKVLGSYDVDHAVLTIVQFSQPEGVTEYVNSLWKIQDNPYGGDAANSYNDGPPAPGARPLGPFYELESSSPAAALKPGGSISHMHRTLHLSGPEDSLEKVARTVLRVSLKDIRNAFAR